MNSFSQPANNAFNSTSQAPTSQASITSRQQLEQLWQASPSLPLSRSQLKPSEPWYKQLGRFLMQSLTDGEQVRVWTKITPNGTQWNAYDPKLQRSFSAYSEADLRTWLEQRHYN